jgi:hypothetical protein
VFSKRLSIQAKQEFVKKAEEKLSIERLIEQDLKDAGVIDIY